MPTLDAFLAAADRFAAVASALGTFGGSLQRLDAAAVVRGGQLGADVPASLASCMSTASFCAERVLAAEATCRHRAAVIAAYEAELLLYESQLAGAQMAIGMWAAEFNAWASSGGALPYPSWEPVVPIAPAPPPAWADVRRL